MAGTHLRRAWQDFQEAVSSTAPAHHALKSLPVGLSGLPVLALDLDFLSTCALTAVLLGALLAAAPYVEQRRSLRNLSLNRGAYEPLNRDGNGDLVTKVVQHKSGTVPTLKRAGTKTLAALSRRKAGFESLCAVGAVKTLMARLAFLYDFGSDVYVSYHLHSTHFWWSVLTGVFSLLPFPIAAIIVWPTVASRAQEKLPVPRVLIGFCWALLCIPILAGLDIFLTLRYLFSEPEDPQVFHYMSLRKILEATAEGNFQTMLQAYMLLRLKNPFSLFPPVQHVPRIKPLALCLSILSSMNATKEGFGYLSKYADLQANGSILRFIKIIRDLGVGQPPITLLRDLATQSTVVVEFDLSELSISGLRSICRVCKMSTVLRSLTFKNNSFFEKLVEANNGACINSIMAIISCRPLEHLEFQTRVPDSLLNAAIQQLQRHSRLHTIQMPANNPSELRNEFLDELPSLPPLLQAVWAKDLPKVKEELANGASPQLADGRNRTAVHLAVWKGAYEVLRALLVVPGGLEAAGTGDDLKMTPLHMAGELGEHDCAELLAVSGRSVNDLDFWRRTPLVISSIHGKESVLKVLVSMGADVDLPEQNLQVPLFYAAQNGHLGCLKALLGARAFVDAPDINRCTPLMISAENGHMATLGALVKVKGDIDWRERQRFTPLILATAEGHIPIMDYLLQCKADAAARSGQGTTALTRAAEQGMAEVVPLLIKKGANVNARNDSQWRPLHCAAQCGQPDVAKALVRARADLEAQTSDGGTALISAIWNNNTKMVDLLLSSKCDPNQSNYTNVHPLHFAVKKQSLEAIASLLKYRATVDAPMNSGATPLYIAAEDGLSEVSLALLDGRANIDAAMNNGQTPLLAATGAEGEDAVKALLERRADLDAASQDGENPLAGAASRGRLPLVVRLLEARASLARAERAGLPALVAATAGGHEEVASYLLQRGCSPHELKSSNGETPLYGAAGNGLMSTVERLLEANAEANLAKQDNYTPLYAAALGGHLCVVERLLAAKASLAMHSAEGETPLHAAATGGHDEVARHILSFRAAAEINASTKNGETALILAAKSKNEKLEQLLLSNRATAHQVSQDGETALLAASLHASADVIKQVIEAKGDVNKSRPNGISPLFLASYEGHVESVKVLTKSKAAVHQGMQDGATPLFVAAQCGHVETIEALVAMKADCNKARDNGLGPLAIAVSNQRTDAVRCLVKQAADVDWATSDGATSLFLAAQQGFKALVEILASVGADRNKAMTDGTNPLHIAVIKGHEDVVLWLLERTANPNTRNDSCAALWSASVNGHSSIAKTLLQYRASTEPQFEGQAPLYAAVQKRDIFMVDLLLAQDANPDIARGPNGKLPLHLAIAAWDYWAVQALLACLADASLRTPDNITPLAMAAYYGQEATCQSLLAARADQTAEVPQPPLAAIGQKGELKPLRPTAHLNAIEPWVTFGAPDLMRSEGRFYYEVRFNQGVATPQVGWASSDFQYDLLSSGDGVGDDEHSWGADGMRHLQWHGGSEPCQWPERWAVGGVVGCAIDLAAGRMEYTYNGKHLPAADFNFNASGRSFYPAASMEGDFQCHFSSACMQFPREGYQPISAGSWPPEPRPKPVYGTPVEVAERAGHRSVARLLGSKKGGCFC